MSDHGNAQSTTATLPAPVFGRAALAVLGTMILLIVALTVLLVQNTWATSATVADSPPELHQSSLGSR